MHTASTGSAASADTGIEFLISIRAMSKDDFAVPKRSGDWGSNLVQRSVRANVTGADFQARLR